MGGWYPECPLTSATKEGHVLSSGVRTTTTSSPDLSWRPPAPAPRWRPFEPPFGEREISRYAPASASGSVSIVTWRRGSGDQRRCLLPGPASTGGTSEEVGLRGRRRWRGLWCRRRRRGWRGYRGVGL